MSYKFRLAVRWCTLSAFLHFTMMSCSESEPTNVTTGSFESMVAAGMQKRVVFLTEGDTLSIEVISIEDSRCPSDVNCVWAGVAQVNFSIAGSGQVIALYVPGHNSEHPSSSTFLFSGKEYQLTLVDVTPYPTRENHECKQIAHFKVHDPA